MQPTGMTLDLILFTIAFLGILVMLIYRSIEVSTGMNIVPRGLRRVLDKKTESVFSFCKRVAILTLSKMETVYNKGVGAIKESPKIVATFFYRKFEKQILLVQGKGAMSTKGSVSFFLNDALEHKKKLRRQ